MQRIPKKIYHYCSVDSFHKIIESKSIWLSNCSQMNDSEEATWIEAYFDFIKNYFRDEKYYHFRKHVFPTYGWNKRKPYIFCFSELKDSLSQWRAYANDGKGICIGFNVDNLEIKKDLPSTNVYRDNTIGLCKVEYNKSVQKRRIKELVEHYLEMYDRRGHELWEVSSAFLAFQLVDFSLIFKNPSFAEEKEWRIIHTPLGSQSEYEDVENKIDISDIKFRVLGNKLTTYAVLNLAENFNSSLIPEIILGPKSEVDEEILKKFLEANHLNKTAVIKSKSTYR